METHAFGFTLRANAPEGQKRFLSVALALRIVAFVARYLLSGSGMSLAASAK